MNIMKAIGIIKDILSDVYDGAVGSFSVISAEHDAVHQGRAFSAYGTTGELAASAAYSFSIKTPNRELFMHFKPIKYHASANYTTVTILRDAVTTGGSILPNVNRNDNSNVLSEMVITTGVTIATPGTTQIYFDSTGATGGPNSNSGGEAGALEEMVLRKNTNYSVTITNAGALTASTAIVQFFWYNSKEG